VPAGQITVPVEPAEATGTHDRDEYDTGPRTRRAGPAQIRISNATDEQVADGQVEEAHSTLTVEEDNPSLAARKRLWNGCPEIPLPRWGRVFARKAPPKKYAT